MKKYILIFSIGLGAMLSSCSNLDQQPRDSIGPDSFFQTENDLKLYTNSFYNMLPSAEGVYNEHVDNIVHTSPSDFVQGSRITPTSGGGWDWGDLRNINFYLERSGNCSDEAARNRYDGVARFFRAYFYFTKVRNFGDVPWYDKVILETDTEALMKARDPRTVVIDNIIADLDFAIANLPEAQTPNEISRWTALALKARVCLWEGTFRKYHTEFSLSGVDELLAESIEAAEELMTEGGYDIYNTGNPEVDYRDLFASMSPIGTEVILARNFSDGLQVYHNLNYYTISASYGRPGLEKRLVDSYLMKDGTRFTDKDGYRTMPFWEETKDRDLRLSQTIRTPGYTRIGETEQLAPGFGGTVTGYQIVKFVTTAVHDTYNNSSNAMPIFRYGEVLLNYCEAKAERGTITQADIDKTIKLLRDRVGMPNLDLAAANADPDPYMAGLYPAVSGGNKGVILEIRRERGVELVMENFRYDDVRRWKAGKMFEAQFRGMYFPGLGYFDMDGDGDDDVCLYQGTQPAPVAGVQYLEVGSTMVLENGDSGCILIYPAIVKKWDEDKDYLSPLPIDQLLLNRNLKQNPNWEGIN